MIHIKRILLIFLLLFIACNNQKTAIKEKKKNTEKNSKIFDAYLFVYKNKLFLFDDTLKIKDSLFINDKINAIRDNNDIFLMSDSMYYRFSIQSLTLSKNNEKFDKFKDIIFTNNKIIFLLKNSIISKDKYQQNILLKSDIPLEKIWLNPYSNYIYIIDSLNYLYSIDIDENILKRRFFIGNMKKLNFEKMGTRLYILTEKSFIILDYETLNIIYENKNYFSDFISNPRFNQFILEDKSKNKLSIFNSIDYNKIKTITGFNSINNLISNNDSLIAFIDNNTIEVFSKQKILKKTIKNKIKNIIAFYKNNLFYDTDDSIYCFNIKNNKTNGLLSSNDLLKIFPIILDSSNIKTSLNYDKKQQSISQINYKKEKIIDFYSIQIASFSDLFSAKKTLKSMKNKNLEKTSFIKVGKKDDKKIFRIYIGKFDNKKDAQKYRKILISNDFKNDIFIMKISSRNIIE